MLLSTVAAGCIYSGCILLGCTSFLFCFYIGLFLVLLSSQQILFFLFVWLVLWVLCSLPTYMFLCPGLLLPVSLCVSNSLVLPLVCTSDISFLHLFYFRFLHPKIGGWLRLLLLVRCRVLSLGSLCRGRSYTGMVGPLVCADLRLFSRLSYVRFRMSRLPIYVPVYRLLTASSLASMLFA